MTGFIGHDLNVYFTSVQKERSALIKNTVWSNTLKINSNSVKVTHLKSTLQFTYMFKAVNPWVYVRLIDQLMD